MSKSQVSEQVHQISTDLKEQLQLAYVKVNAELQRLMGPDLTKCIEQSKNDEVKISECYDKLQKRIQPTLQKLKQRALENNTTLQKCLDSKQNAKVCAKVGLDKSQEYLNEAFNDLKSYLS